MATEVRQIKISVDAKGFPEIQKVSDALGGMSASMKTLSGSFRSFNGLLGFSIAGIGIKRLVEVADSMQLLNSRLIVLNGTQEAATKAFDGIVERANNSRVSIATLGETYARLGSVLKSTGIQTSTLLDVTEVLQNTFKISGSNAQEAANASVQLAQGLALGTLRGQDLKSVLSQNVVFGDLLAKQLKLTRAEVYKFAESGRITSDVVLKALLGNAQEVNATAAKMASTFGQTLTVAFNKLEVAVGAVNTKLSLSDGFAKILEIVEEKAGLIGIAIGLLATSQLPALVASLAKLSIAAYGFVASNPLLAALGAAVIAVVALSDNIDSLAYKINKITIPILSTVTTIMEFGVAVDKQVLGRESALAGFYEKITGKVKSFNDELKASNKSYNAPTSGLPEVEEFLKVQKAQDDYIKGLKGTKEVVESLKNPFKALNTEFLKGGLSVEGYFDKLETPKLHILNEEFKRGKIDLEAYTKGVLAINIRGLNRDFSEGLITFRAFNDGLRELKVEELSNKLKSGKIALIEYYAELVKITNSPSYTAAFVTGVDKYLTSIGTLASNIADGVSNTFGTLENSFNDFIKNGEFNFKQFAQSVLDDLQKIIVRAAIIRPLAEGILGGFPSSPSGTTTAGSSYGNYSNVSAHGNVFDSGLKKFASGGIVSSPTTFGYGNGKAGLMGEAGPEAIIPLSRGSGGDLGVKASLNPVTINIMNSTGSEVTQKETVSPGGSRTIDILIQSKVRDGLASGAFDKTFQQAYGLKRRGS